MDQLAPGSASRTNPRFSQEGRTRELEDERNHLARLSMMLQRHGELATRLQEVAEAEDEPQVAVEPEIEDEANPLTGTQTSRELIQMFNLGSGGDPGTRSPPGMLDDGEERLSTVLGSVSQPKRSVRGRVVLEPARARPQRPGVSSYPPTAPSSRCGNRGSRDHRNDC